MKKILISITAFILLTSTATARELYFTPTLGNFNPQTPLPERFQVTQNDQLHGFTFYGETLENFPISLNSNTQSYVTSPLLINIDKQGSDELVIIQREVLFQPEITVNYTLKAYTENGQEFLSENLDPSLGHIAYDLVALENNILVSGLSGYGVYNYNSETASLDFQAIPTAFASRGGATSLNNNDIVLTSHNPTALHFFHFQDNSWQPTNSIEISESDSHDAAVADNQNIYQFTSDGVLHIINRTTNAVSNRIDLNAKFASKPTITEHEENNRFIGITLQNGKTLIIDQQGNVIFNKQLNSPKDTQGINAENQGFTLNLGTKFIHLSDLLSTPNISLISPHANKIILTPPTQPSENLIFNGDIESPVDFETADQWRRYGNILAIREIINEGINDSRAIYVDTTSEEPGADRGGIQQTNIPVEAGKWYLLSLKYNSNRGYTYVRLGQNSSNSDYQNNQALLPRTYGVWGTYERKFRVPTLLQPDFRFVMVSRVGRFWLDNISITEISDQPFVVNGSAEDLQENYDTHEGWRRYSIPEVIETTDSTSTDGQHSIYIKANTPENPRGGIQQTRLQLEHGMQYKISYNYKVSNENSTATKTPSLYTRIGENSSNRDFENNQEVFYNTNGEWLYHERFFTPTPGFIGDFRIIFQARNAEVWLDNIVIEEIGPAQLN